MRTISGMSLTSGQVPLVFAPSERNTPTARSNAACGATGVTSRPRWRGETIGPRAESE